MTARPSVPTRTVDAGRYWLWLIAESPLDEPYVLGERDEFAIEAWRRETVPQWTYRPKARGTHD